VRAIVAGQRGVGKTTELKRLARFSTSKVEFIEIDQRAIGKKGAGTLYHIAGILAERWEYHDFAESSPDLKDVLAFGQERFGSLPVLLLDGGERIANDESVLRLLKRFLRLDCSVILAVRLPTGLVPEFDSIKDDWGYYPLSAVSVCTPDRAYADESGWNMLKELLRKRSWEGAFNKAALRILIPASAGIYRELITMAEDACLQAYQANKTVVTEVEATAALLRMRLKHIPRLSAENFNLLKQIAHGKRDRFDKTWADFINNNRLIGYHSENMWFDVHSILWPVLEITEPRAPKSFT